MNYLWMLLALFLFFGFPNYSTSILTTGTITRNIEEENAPLIVSESVQGSYGKLPCNITPPVAEDRLALVIWYKDGHTKPIYSFDMRQIKFETGTHWADDNFDGRVHFDVTGKPAALTIKNTNKDDNGLYRCRVDFQKSPTRNSKVKLQVIIPPEKLVILDDGGNNIPTYILGPYNEGSSINITCVSTGGRPPPQVTWWHDSILLDDTTKLLSDRRVSNVLEMKKLKRSHLGMVLTCQASNNNLTRPISSAVKLDMNLRPLVVKLQGENRPLSAENSYQLSCVVVGSRPAPTITWWKGSTPMKNTHERSNPDGNMTTSILTFTPTIDDRGKYLSCRAEQSLIPESGMEDGWKLDIYHIPVVTLELGTNMNSSFREGIDVFFECNIKSNPWIYKVSWRHNGNLLENNLAEGIIVANQSLVLQNVSRARSGIYTCVGSNREGDGESNPVQLDIRFAPICRPGQRNIYSTGRQEIIKVACEVEANPSDVSFVWKFNASMAESVDIPASLVAVDRGRSVAHYTPMTEHDYGTLLCWGTNEIGDQIDPCVYSITPAGEPDSLINCTVLNQTSTSFQIECIEGFDGGLPQDFVMEVFVNGTTRHPKIYRSKTPYFESRGLVPGVGYNVFVIAQNNKGRSNATILQVYTLKDPEKQTDLSLAYAPVIEDIRPFLGILVGIVVSIFLVALIIVIIVRMRGSTGRDRNNYSHQVSRDGLHNGQSIQDIRIGRDACQTSSVDSIDKNPDIIPQDGRDEDDEWTTKGHNRAFATAALAEQNAIIGSSYDRIPYAVIDKKGQNHIQQQQQLQHQHHSHQQIMNQQQQQHLHHPHTAAPQYMTTYSTLIPVSKMAYVTQHQQQQQQQQQQQHPQLQQQLLQHQPQQQHQQHQQQQHQQHQQQQHQQNKTELTYAELAAPSQRIPYCSATLGRPRQSDIKRAEPNIYSQIDLAHHPMYSTSSMYGTQTMTGVTMSHPSQLATFPPPPAIFTQNKPTINSSKISIATSSAGVGLGSGLGSLAVSAIGGAGNGHGNSGMTSPCGSGSIQIGNGIGGGILPSSSSSHPATNNVPSAGICFAETNASTSSVVLKTVPEEIAGQMSGGSGEQLKSANVNHATRF